MSPISPRLTIRDVAREAGCHYSTVSLALSNHPRITAETKARVQAAVDRLGYQPDPSMSALCAYRTGKRPVQEKAVLAWLTNYRTENHWKASACNCDYFDGAFQRAVERGYRLESFWLAAPHMNHARMSEILWARGIQGVLLPPQPHLATIHLQWQRFSAVTFGHTLVDPRLHLVSNHEYRTMNALFAELVQRGYGRVGLVELRDHDERVDHNWLAAYLVEQQRLRRKDRIAPLLLPKWDRQTFLAWTRQHKPDVIVTKLPEVLQCLQREGMRVAEDIGVAFHSLDEKSTGLTGMRKNAWQIGVMAVDLLIDMIHRGERGVPTRPSLLMVEGSWVEGSTLRPKPGTNSAQPQASAPVPAVTRRGGPVRSTV